MVRLLEAEVSQTFYWETFLFLNKSYPSEVQSFNLIATKVGGLHFLDQGSPKIQGFSMLPLLYGQPSLQCTFFIQDSLKNLGLHQLLFRVLSIYGSQKMNGLLFKSLFLSRRFFFLISTRIDLVIFKLSYPLVNFIWCHGSRVDIWRFDEFFMK